MVNTLNSIHTIFSNTSFGKWISEFEKENIAEVIKNPHDTVTNEQRIQLIGKLQRFIDSYINREYIIRKLKEEEEIHDSPLGYATFLLLKEQ